MSENRDQTTETAAFKSLDTLYKRWKEGTFGEILEDWKWIFSYSGRYKGAIVFYTILGIFSSTLALVSGVVSKYIIDIVTGYQYEKLGTLIALGVGSSIFSLVFSSVLNRVTAKLSLRIRHEIQADIFDKIMDSDWLTISEYRSGDILNRFSNDARTISSNAVSWLPNIVIAVYSLLATFAVIWNYSKVMALLAVASAPIMLVSGILNTAPNTLLKMPAIARMVAPCMSLLAARDASTPEPPLSSLLLFKLFLFSVSIKTYLHE